MTSEMDSRPEQNTPDLQQLGHLILPQILELNSRMHELTSPELSLGIREQKIISELGMAAYHLAQASGAIPELDIVVATDEVKEQIAAPITPIRETLSDDVTLEQRREATLKQFVYDFCKQNNMISRSKAVISQILSQFYVDRWFEQAEIDLSMIEYKNEAARRSAYRTIVPKLVELYLLIDNGIQRGGKKYRINEAAIPAILVRKSE